MIHKARFNSILFLLAFFGGLVLGIVGGVEAGLGFAMAMLWIWFFTMLASFIKLALTGKPLLYNTKVSATKDGGYTEH